MSTFVFLTRRMLHNVLMHSPNYRVHDELLSQSLLLFQARPKVFCAGLDLNELLNAKDNEAEFREYWKIFLDTVITLYGAQPVSVAAVNVSMIDKMLMITIVTNYSLTM